jgi:hypothetical protein
VVQPSRLQMQAGRLHHNKVKRTHYLLENPSHRFVAKFYKGSEFSRYPALRHLYQ